MLNWKTYKTLNQKQKDEYNFRFKNAVQPPFQFLVLWSFLLVLIQMVNMFVTYITITTPEMSKYVSNISFLFSGASTFIFASAILLIGCVIEYLVRLTIQVYQFNKWKKENNIKSIYWYSK